MYTGNDLTCCRIAASTYCPSPRGDRQLPRRVALSQTSLQQRMKRALGRTIREEIERARLDRAKELLAMSDLHLKQVALQSGFSSVQYMTRVFHAAFGQTPARYRRALKAVPADDAAAGGS